MHSQGSIHRVTRSPRPRSGSYRDPHLSDQWLSEAEWRARHAPLWPRDARKIIHRLIQEVRDLNEEAGR